MEFRREAKDNRRTEYRWTDEKIKDNRQSDEKQKITDDRRKKTVRELRVESQKSKR